MYLAHITEDKLRKQTMKEHLLGVAKLAEGFADAFGCGKWGYGFGLLHDIGKYSEKFQKRLLGGPITDHATAGAKELYNRKNIPGAYCVAGHHSGLLDGGSPADAGGEATLSGRMQKRLEDYTAFQKEIDIPDFPRPPLRQIGKGGFSMSFFIRMLYSCVVDADFLDTEAFMSDTKKARGVYDPMEALWGRLGEYIAPWLANEDSSTVNGRRTAILKACIEKGREEQGLFQLTVPTGGGKTVSSLAFALEHAQRHHLNRIIYVIPYTSIIEQNAGIFRDILGGDNVLEDHCNVAYEDGEELNRKQLAAENWDSPVIVTTNVQFFESLFSSRTSKCRKLHNIANSVIIFDEAQMLPVTYLKPCIQAMSELVYNYHCTAVICTATQPALQQFFPSQLSCREICPDVEEQYRFFKRTRVHNGGVLSQENLIEELSGQEQVLCILNSRKRVQLVYDALRGDGTYHLSTLMYPKHRKRLLREIRERLKTGKACRLIATSLVEAGVDFDFPNVYRELAGIDSIIQAAGRCNREGKRKSGESVTVAFKLEQADDIHLPGALKLPVSVAEQILEKYEDITSPEAVEEYFRRLYHYKGGSLDAKKIVEQMEECSKSLLFPFATVAGQFKIIENNTKTILIDLEPEARELANRLEFGGHSRELLREIGQYCVSIYDRDFENLMGAGCLRGIDEEYYVLRNPELYDGEKGLCIQAERGEAVFF